MTSNFLIYCSNGERFIQRGKSLGKALAKFQAENPASTVTAILDELWLKKTSAAGIEDGAGRKAVA